MKRADITPYIARAIASTDTTRLGAADMFAIPAVICAIAGMKSEKSNATTRDRYPARPESMGGREYAGSYSGRG
jgi:hypothetical protein